MTPEAAAATMILPVHRLTPYIRTRISTDDRSLTIVRRRSLIGLIPLWTHRIEIPLTELAAGRVKTNVRLQCLAAAGVLAVSVFLLDLPLALRVVLVIWALLECLLALAPGKAMWIERSDGRSWTIAFCRAHDFDASLALEDAVRRRDALAEREVPAPRTSARPATPSSRRSRTSAAN